MVCEGAFIFVHIFLDVRPLYLIPKPSSSVRVKVEYQGHNLKKKL